MVYILRAMLKENLSLRFLTMFGGNLTFPKYCKRLAGFELQNFVKLLLFKQRQRNITDKYNVMHYGRHI